jgi:hypothetical protein
MGSSSSRRRSDVSASSLAEPRVTHRSRQHAHGRTIARDYGRPGVEQISSEPVLEWDRAYDLLVRENRRNARSRFGVRDRTVCAAN